jgi:hypothetical protein
MVSMLLYENLYDRSENPRVGGSNPPLGTIFPISINDGLALSGTPNLLSLHFRQNQTLENYAAQRFA